MLTKSSNPTQHAQGRMADCSGPCKETTTRRNVTQGGWKKGFNDPHPAAPGARKQKFPPPPVLSK